MSGNHTILFICDEIMYVSFFALYIKAEWVVQITHVYQVMRIATCNKTMYEHQSFREPLYLVSIQDLPELAFFPYSVSFRRVDDIINKTVVFKIKCLNHGPTSNVHATPLTFPAARVTHLAYIMLTYSWLYKIV